ncbi:hypothetical protein VTN96DRAFT_3093 [Rasamsonia emersonii]|uniref:Uncharacterized protein n=1 Tax=Rasamsonia emersonii (strain ATCC 16479 / CBS 393.64 / IMI 116815) TaxID=1408163 RepID=A0A0F4YE29_RASE3|nr:hypothetical protein T310_10002 [Rasamsonia emersonii CBS 393.64]KKA16395.1 hypothetical protein T310_10002 [Rasamsonia emersonii CBS 393.64]
MAPAKYSNSASEYRFEDSPALRHGCAVCKTCLNNPRAKLTCFGKHAEPCVRFHQTMFRLGCSHKCEPCRNSLEQHDKRHREIGTLVREIQEMDNDNGSSSAGLDEGEEDWVDIDARTEASIDDLLQLQSNDESQPSSSSSLSSSLPSSPSPLLRKSTRNQRSAAKHAKQLARVLKRKQKLRPVSPGLTAEFIEKIQLAIHEYSAASFSTADRERVNQALLKDIQIERRIQQQEDHHLVKSSKTAATAALEIGHIRNVMSSLGIEPPTPTSVARESKERRTLLEKLGNAIKVDIETVANEARETMTRQASYYRYADRRTYNAMVRNKQLFDWQTGKELAELALNANDEQGDETETVLQAEEEEGPNEQNGDADVDSRAATTAEESRKEDRTTNANAYENDLVLCRSPGTLIFSLKPAEKSPEEANHQAADSDSQQPAEPEGPEHRSRSPGREKETQETQETVRIEPIITHMKRQPGSKKKKAQKRKPLLEKKQNSLNAKKKNKPESLPVRKSSSSSSKENRDDGHEEEEQEESAGVSMQEDQKVSQLQPGQSESETAQHTTTTTASVEATILEDDTKESESSDTKSEKSETEDSPVQQPSDITQDEEEEEVIKIHVTINTLRRRRFQRMVLRPRPRVNWEAMFVKWASMKIPDPRRVVVED